MSLEIQGQKCRTYDPRFSPKKRSTKVSLFMAERSLSSEKKRSKSIMKSSIHTSPATPMTKQDFVIKPELLSVCLPKMLSKTPSPLRGTRSKFDRLRLSVYAPIQLSPAELTLQLTNNENKAISKVLNKSLQIAVIHKKQQYKQQSLALKLTKTRHNDVEMLSPVIKRLRIRRNEQKVINKT